VTRPPKAAARRAILSMAWLVLLALSLLSGCTWVAVAPDATHVRIAPSDTLGDCKQVGTTKTRTKARIGIFVRSEKKVAQELETLARNDAPELGGNTIAAEGPVSADGMQRFAIYDCPTAAASATSAP